jgi:hypothetical protein
MRDASVGRFNNLRIGKMRAGAAAVRLPRERLDEIRRIVEDEIPPHRWHVVDEEKLTSLPPHIHE